jgi:hypothetical protein
MRRTIGNGAGLGPSGRLVAAGAVSAAAVVVLAQLRGPAVDVPTAVVLVAALAFFARTAIGLAADSPRRDVDRPS